MEPLRVIWSGERAFHVTAPKHRPSAIYAAIDAASIAGIAEITPGSGTVQVRLDADARAEPVITRLREILTGSLEAVERATGRLVEVPICYEGDLAPDLEAIARGAGMSPHDAADLHASGTYTVGFLGFAPGFPYIDGLPEALHAPRLDTPRTRVRRGSVGIAGARTGIYPRPSPGGWRLIGATPLKLFDPTRQPAALLSPGDRVRFRRIGRQEFDAFEAERG
ncbi:MAG: 5-oxoprolinase subunit PxpB [Planctomycetota bacterium]